jgi:hypothetical protein
MTSNSKATKEQLLKMIDQLQKNPDDKVRLLGDTGITIVGAGLGAAAAGTVASAVGATSIFGLTTAASWFGSWHCRCWWISGLWCFSISA